MKLRFDPRHARLTPERTPFLVLDGAAAVTPVGLWLAAAKSVPRVRVGVECGSLDIHVERRARGFDGWRADVATGLGTFGGLVLIGAGLALLVGLVGKRSSTANPANTRKPLYPPKPSGKPGDRIQ